MTSNAPARKSEAVQQRPALRPLGPRIDYASVVIPTAFALAVWLAGYFWLGRIMPDMTSEERTIQDAIAIALRRHSWGIVQYAHFPNGPVYLLVPFFWGGWLVQTLQLRLIHLTLSALAAAFFVRSLVRSSVTRMEKAGLLAAAAIVFAQPAFYRWQGTLHEFSLSFALSLVLMGLAIHPGSFRHTWVWLLGFLSGWIGYDFIPSQVIAVVTVRLLVHYRTECVRLGTAIINALKDGLVFASGILYAVAAHLIQNALAFGDFKTAVGDLLLTASYRAGQATDEMLLLSNEGQESLFGTYNPLVIAKGMWKSFAWGTQSTYPQGVVYGGAQRWCVPWLMFLMAAGILLWVIRNVVVMSADRPRFRWDPLAMFGAALAGILGSSVAWYFLMPSHSSLCLMFLPRHFLMGMLLLAVVPLVLRPEPVLADGLSRAALANRWGWNYPLYLLPAFFLIGSLVWFRVYPPPPRRPVAMPTALPWADQSAAQEVR